MRYLAVFAWTAAAFAVQAGFDGTWEAPAPGFPTGILIELKTDGARISGSFSGPNGRLEIRNGAVSGGEVRFDIVTPFQGRSITTHFTGRVSGAELTLTGEMPGIEQKLLAKRRAADAPAPDWFSSPPAPPEIGAWLKANAIPLDDPAALKGRLKDVRIVAMGEATHATHEFQVVKDRVFRMLVEELGFTVFAIESPWALSPAVNDYVQGKTADLSLYGPYIWWQTREVVDLLHWMRAYNLDSAHPRKLRFEGFDIRGLDVLAGRVESYLKRVDEPLRTSAAALFAGIGTNPESPEYMNAPDGTHRRNAEGLIGLLKRFDAGKEEWVRRTSGPEWEMARQSLVVLTQSEEKGRLGDIGGSASRDKAMAENVKWILDHEPPATKVMLWAHNGHVADELTPWLSMGSHLRGTYGDAMAICGFAFGEGSFRAIEMGTQMEKTFTVGPPPQGSLDATLAAVGLPLFAVDLRAASGPAAEWFAAPHISRRIGGGYSESSWAIFLQRVRARPAFDVLIFVAKTTPTQPW